VSAARKVLERLLRRAESARRRGADAHVGLNMAKVAEYATLDSLEALDRFHAELALAERAGALQVRRDVHRGDGATLLHVAVADLTALARHLGVDLLDERVANAAAALAPWRARFAVLDQVLQAWQANRKVRGVGPEAADELAEAARVVVARLEDAGHERILRRESVRLCGDSKRLEKLTPWLELLIGGELAAAGLAREEVWSAIGLRREPQPLLLAGRGELRVSDVRLPLVAPYLGVPVESMQSASTPAACLLTIENLASFHDATRAPGARDVLLLYTGGMPSPAWRAAYRRLLGSLDASMAVLHWGDIDEGGFRIAALLAATAGEVGRVLQPWCMSPASLPDAVRQHAATPPPAQLAGMLRWARRAGWPGVAKELEQRPLVLEQESLDALLPSARVLAVMAPGG
jgi:hypothetical protein